MGKEGELPIDLDEQFYYNSVATGANNNRWRGLRRWPNEAEWIIESCHMVELTVAEHQPLQRGQQYAVGAGVWVGQVEHSHFTFAIHDHGQTIRLDPWILFRQMYLDQAAAARQ